MTSDEMSYWLAGNAVWTYLQGGKRFSGSIDPADDISGFNGPSFGCPREIPLTCIGWPTVMMKFRPRELESLELDEETEQVYGLQQSNTSPVWCFGGHG